ncbi:ectoine synthase [Streptomyces clavuligerus]|uniref:L-ectoine synthase n=1 Tax=Streptomyces clavuligerus TaxID=1901 RepID=B5H1H2_STRCL|nr:ectoine synthase [Streptomyces clavuligerus]EDY52418.1 L-ectoine synthase [Streptomyces clavuligerus]EFG04783.1 Ectoine/tryptophan synthase [Streptomyces clavuligerus]MBY6306769.1 ectoine synthase [Streptomyces clavuligerus]QCS10628.1 ectoine synthase [Streptomyces clavuligerus]QPJ97334.1 L-ectoine synthase [Streptomyces clavuligerus]
MIVRRLDEVQTVDWGNGLSRRFLLESDGMGYSVTDTTVRAGTKSRLEYRRHLEACYCIAGTGEVVDSSGISHPIEPGTFYALDQHDAHFLIASQDEDLRLVCVFSPALRGGERHSLDPAAFSQY